MCLAIINKRDLIIDHIISYHIQTTTTTRKYYFKLNFKMIHFEWNNLFDLYLFSCCYLTYYFIIAREKKLCGLKNYRNTI